MLRLETEAEQDLKGPTGKMGTESSTALWWEEKGGWLSASGGACMSDLFYTEGAEALAQPGQGGCGCPILGNMPGQVGTGL